METVMRKPSHLYPCVSTAIQAKLLLNNVDVMVLACSPTKMGHVSYLYHLTHLSCATN